MRGSRFWWFVRVPAKCPCVHQIVYMRDHPCVCVCSLCACVCACACLTSLWFSDHMILYISCSIGCWTASTAHNNVKICSIWIPLSAVNVWLLMQPKLRTFVKYMSFDWYRSGANKKKKNKLTKKSTLKWTVSRHLRMASSREEFCKLKSVTIQLSNSEDLQS